MGNFCFALGFFPKLTGRKEKDTYWKGLVMGILPATGHERCQFYRYCLFPHRGALASSSPEQPNDITLGFKKQDAWAKRIQKQQVALAPSPETDGCLQPGLQTEQGWVQELLRAWQHFGTQGEQGKN